MVQPTPSPTPTPRVGKNKYTQTKAPTITQTPAPQITLDPNSLAMIGQIFNSKAVASGGTPINPNLNIPLLELLDDSQLQRIGQLLKKMGYSVKASKGDIKALFKTEPVLNSVLSTSNGFQDLYTNLQKDYVPLGKTGEESLPSRTITKQDPVVLGKMIDSVYTEQLGRLATDEEKARHISNFQNDINQGTLTTTKKVKNVKTGKMENVTTVESSFSQSKAEADISEQLKRLNPDDFDRKKRIDFSSWIAQNVGGGGTISA